MILDLNFRLTKAKQRTEETAAISKEKSIFPDGNGTPNKRLTYKKCFVRPLVDYQLQIISKTLDGLR